VSRSRPEPESDRRADAGCKKRSAVVRISHHLFRMLPTVGVRHAPDISQGRRETCRPRVIGTRRVTYSTTSITSQTIATHAA